MRKTIKIGFACWTFNVSGRSFANAMVLKDWSLRKESMAADHLKLPAPCPNAHCCIAYSDFLIQAKLFADVCEKGTKKNASACFSCDKVSALCARSENARAFVATWNPLHPQSRCFFVKPCQLMLRVLSPRAEWMLASQSFHLRLRLEDLKWWGKVQC